ncbi:hypothetical protein JG688_00006441 [Phytophthora aleatoria]|uniref:Uncharacterized protein n=1 Tax=Phytophthora aleatoria TaxID=2496075 RepID=A0A8J5IN72_9STRA|nr:hypothetical protein JG688_00006441 [Phytophthora aleatoria]
MKPETFDAPTRANTLNKALQGAISGAFDSIRRLLRGVCEEVTEKSEQSDIGYREAIAEAEQASKPSSTIKTLQKVSVGGALSTVVALKGRSSEETAIEAAQTMDASSEAVQTSRTLSTAEDQYRRSLDVGDSSKEPRCKGRKRSSDVRIETTANNRVSRTCTMYISFQECEYVSG